MKHQPNSALHIGGQEVCRMDSLFIQGVHNVISQKQSKASCAVTASEVADNAKGTGTGTGDHYRIPFFFSEDWTKALPLVDSNIMKLSCELSADPA